MEIFKLFGSIFVDSSAAQDSISKTSGKAETLGTKLTKGIKTAAKWATAVVAAAGAVGGAMLGAANKVAKTADEIDKASRRAGTTAENYQKLKYAMGQSGISAEKFEKTMIRNQKAVNEAAEGNKAYADTYKALGVSIEDASGNMRSADDIYNETLRKLADMEDINQRNALANQLFGKSYADLAPILDSGSQGIDDLTKRAEKLGLVMSQETVDAGVKFGDTMDDIKQMGGAVFNMIGAELLPIMQVFLDWIIAAAPQIQETVHGIVEFAREVISGFQEFWKEHGETIKAVLSSLFKAIGAIIESAFTVISGIFNAFCSLLEGDWEGFWDGIVQAVKGVGTLLYKAGKAIFNSLFDGIKSVWTSISNWVTEKVEWITAKFEAVKTFLQGIKDSIMKAASASAETRANRTTTSNANVQAHAVGGILTKPTIFGYTPSTNTYHLGGEAGAEAIAPIDTLQGYVRAAVAAENEGQESLLEAILTVLQAILDKDTAVYLSGKEISKAVNKELGVVF